MQMTILEICVICLLFTGVVVMSLGGNGIVIWIILAHKRMRSVTNYFLLNLSIADTMSILHIVPNIYYTIQNDWIFGIGLCKLTQFITTFGVSFSVLTFIGIAIERFNVIMFPLRPKFNSKQIKCAIFIIWLISVFSGLPGVIYGGVQIINATANSSASQYCEIIWVSRDIKYTYEVFLFVLQYVVPLSVLTITYIPISYRLWHHQPLGECTTSQGESIRSKKKVVKMMIAVIVIFAVCWLPYQLFFMVMIISPGVTEGAYIPYIFLFCYWLACSNSMSNPIIYFIMNKRFRAGLKEAINCLLCRPRESSTPANYSAAASNNNCNHLNRSTANFNDDSNIPMLTVNKEG